MNSIRLKDVCLKNLINERATITFLARDVGSNQQKNGSKFLYLSLCDGEKVEDAKIFNVSEQTIEMVKAGNVYDAVVDIREYSKSPKGYSCIIDSIQYSELSASEFLEWEPNLSVHYESITDALRLLQGSFYYTLTSNIISNNWTKFQHWVAGKAQHHCALGGLMAHTAAVVMSSKALGEVYSKVYGEQFINMPLLISAALLHDVMKIDELEVSLANGTVEYSTSSYIETHIMGSMFEVVKEANVLGIYDTEEIKLLLHLIASHHGKLEWGSPITPSTPEAYILSVADLNDSYMDKFYKSFKEMIAGSGTRGKAYQGLDRIYKDNTKR